MVKTVLSDFSRVILFPKDLTYTGRLAAMHGKLQQEQERYAFFDYFQFNEELLTYYDSIKNKVELCVFTESTNIMQVLEVRKKMERIFAHIFTTHDVGSSKGDPRAFFEIAQRIKKESPEILFIDDRAANIDAASKAGLQTVQYIDNKQLIDKLHKLL